jgi:hypothetical protein
VTPSDGVSEGLLGLAAVAAAGNDADRAACLVGAARAHACSQQHGIRARLDASFLYPARVRHGADASDAAVRRGAGLSFEEAIAAALEEPGPEGVAVRSR